MKSAGKRSSNASSPWCGAPHWANGIEPQSNHTSITSGTRRMASPHSGHGNSTSSTNGRWGSSSRVPESSASSASDPITWTCPAAQRHAGSGVPQ